jgi:hypothetical protein
MEPGTVQGVEKSPLASAMTYRRLPPKSISIVSPDSQPDPERVTVESVGADGGFAVAVMCPLAMALPPIPNATKMTVPEIRIQRFAPMMVPLVSGRGTWVVWLVKFPV